MTRLTITSAVAALSVSLAPAAQAYTTAPESSVTSSTSTLALAGSVCTVTPTQQLARLLNLPLDVADRVQATRLACATN